MSITVAPGSTNPPLPDHDRADRRALLMLLSAIAVCGMALAYDTILVVKITAFYSVTDADFGLIFGLSSFLMAAASIPWGYLADRSARLPLIRLSLGLIGASMIGSGLAFLLDLPWSFFVVVKVLLAGVGMAGIGPVATSAVMDTVTLARRGAAFGWVGVAWAAGGAVGLLLPGACLAGGAGLGLTYLIGAAGVAAFTAGLFLVAEPRRGSQDHALRDTVGAGASYDFAIRLSDLRPLLSRPVNLLLVPATLFYQFPIQTLAVWFVTFLMRNHAATEMTASLLMLLAFLGQPFGNALGGSMTDRAFERRRTGRVRVMIAMALAAPLIFVAALLAPFHWILFSGLMIAANFFIVASGPGLTTVSLEVNLPEHRGTITAVLAVCSNLARALGWYVPPLIAAAFGGRYDLAFLVTAASYLPLLAFYLLLHRRVESDLDRVHDSLTVRARAIGKSDGGR